MNCIVVGVADRACERTNAGFLAAIAESDPGVLRTAIRMMDDVVRLSGCDRHVESVEYDAGLQIGRAGPSDDPARPGVENDRGRESRSTSPQRHGQKNRRRGGDRPRNGRFPVGHRTGSRAPVNTMLSRCADQGAEHERWNFRLLLPPFDRTLGYGD